MDIDRPGPGVVWLAAFFGMLPGLAIVAGVIVGLIG